MLSLTVSMLQGQTLSDTVITRIVPPVASWFDQVVGVAQGLLSILAVVLCAVLIFLVLRVRKSVEALQVSVDAAIRDVKGVVDRAKDVADGVADNVTAISDAVREDVDELRETVEYANRRARHAVGVMADRVDEFNAALEAVQRDTQGVVVTALAAFRGVRKGLAAMRKKPRRPQPAEMAFDEGDEDIEVDLPARPRLRRRARGEA